MELWRGTTRKLAVLRLRWRMSTNNGEWFCWRPEGSAMPGLNRSLAIPQDEVGVYHCFMRVWCSHIGRRANWETGKSGRFFEERFKSVRQLEHVAAGVGRHWLWRRREMATAFG